MRRSNIRELVRIAALLVAILAVSAALFGAGTLILTDTSTGSSCTSVGLILTCTSYSRTLLEDQGPLMLVPIAGPVLVNTIVAGLILKQANKDYAWVLSVTLFFICLVTIFTFGAYFILAALLILVATA